MQKLHEVIYLGIRHSIEVVASYVECHVLFDRFTFLQQQRPVLNSVKIRFDDHLHRQIAKRIQVYIDPCNEMMIGGDDDDNKKAHLTQGLRATAPSFQDGRQPPSWILSNRK